MRRGDICDLRLDQHVVDDHLRKKINKSHAQFADPQRSIHASNLSWSLDADPMLRKLIARAREESMKHARCPYFLSRLPIKRHDSKVCEHSHQVLPDFLSKAFAKVRDASGLFDGVAPKKRPSFHEIRALGSHLYEEAGFETSAVQELMAHTNETMTKRYQAGHTTHWTEITLALPRTVTGREF